MTMPPLRVLAVDDDPIFLSLVAACLSIPKFQTTVVDSGVDAMEELQQARFDVALVDLDMPRIDGFRMIALIRSDARFDPMGILVISGCKSVEDRQEAVRLGADTFLSKPVDWAALPDLISRLVVARQQLCRQRPPMVWGFAKPNAAV